MTKQAFQKIVWEFYRLHGRKLPWRKNISPYRIWVSEIMLQQTQVGRVIPKYREFLKAFPNVRILATAPASHVLKLWSGLGYNRRALYLKRAAEMLVRDFGGRFPKDTEKLAGLPGIGKNTAGAIMAYAYGLPAVFIETNIRRVFLHHFFPGKANVPDAQILPLVEKNLPVAKVREWYWALMDYSSFLAKTVENPNRRSSHYVRQSKFEGSLRQARGKIIKLLLEKPRTLHMLRSLAGSDQADTVLQTLIKEGFIEIRNTRASLR